MKQGSVKRDLPLFPPDEELVHLEMKTVTVESHGVV
jgi:hypothetical protein